MCALVRVCAWNLACLSTCVRARPCYVPSNFGRTRMTARALQLPTTIACTRHLACKKAGQKRPAAAENAPWNAKLRSQQQNRAGCERPIGRLMSLPGDGTAHITDVRDATGLRDDLHHTTQPHGPRFSLHVAADPAQ